MSPIRRIAAVVALAGAAAVAGCGFGTGEEVGEVSLTVTRDYGHEVILERDGETADESDTVMRLLDRTADIETRYGGGFVQEIEGLAGGALEDWFFYVNGVESGMGAADYELARADRVWWDFRDWRAARRVPAVVGSWPEPFAHGYEGERRATALFCFGAGRPGCSEAREALEDAGASLGWDAPEGIRILVGPWSLVGRDAGAALITSGPQLSGVFADVVARRGGYALILLDGDGNPAGRLENGAGLVAATRLGPRAPTWVVTGTDARGAARAASLLDAESLDNHYAVAVSPDGERIGLPLP